MDPAAPSQVAEFTPAFSARKKLCFHLSESIVAGIYIWFICILHKNSGVESARAGRNEIFLITSTLNIGFMAYALGES